MKVLMDVQNPVCLTLRHYAWRSAIFNAILYSVLILALSVPLANTHFDDNREHFRIFLLCASGYFIIPFLFTLILMVALKKKNTRILFVWVVFACIDWILTELEAIAVGVYILLCGYTIVGIAFITFGVSYAATMFYAASIVNSLRLLYLNQENQERMETEYAYKQ